MRSRAMRRAASGWPWCIASAPQHPPGAVRRARYPAAATARIVARWTGRKATSMTQPARTVAVGPAPSRAGIGRSISSRHAGGVEARWAGGASRSRRSARAAASSQPAPSTSRRRGRTPARPARLSPRAATGRVGSAWARAASTMRPKGTPLGQAASPARHARHSSIIVVKEASTSLWPSSTARMAAMRPRGDAVSRPVRRKVGQCGRQSPQATHLTMSSVAGAIRPGSQRATVLTPSPDERRPPPRAAECEES